MAMTEFETATLVFQQATVAFQNATVEFQGKALELQEKALDLQLYAIWAQVGVGMLHALLIGVGLWMMHRASSDRNKKMDDDRRNADQRHEESMTALKELIARTAPPSPPSASPAG